MKVIIKKPISNKGYTTSKRGFTLVETFVAITILIMAVIGPLSIFSRSIADGNFSANRITAFYLAQEGLELVFNKKQSNLRNDRDWLFELDSCEGVNICEIELGSTASSCDISDPDGCRLYLNNEGNYTHNNTNGTPTTFKRAVNIEVLGVGEAKVRSIVEWNNEDNPQSLIIDTFTYDVR